ncbi:MAG TPA: carbamate kinase [Methylomirabilota bacterium]|nr:carbamate kinase [Methylomirabilota bacterium]
MSSPQSLVVALGGNALLRGGQSGSFEEQNANFQPAASKIADLVQKDYKVVVTHGNGPQIGYILLKNEIAKKYAPPFPIDACGAQTQGWIGYMIQQSLKNILNARGLEKEVITLITRVKVDKNDPAFQNPTKPIGPFFNKDQVASIMREQPDWIIKEYEGKGFRRVVPSPMPLQIIESKAIRTMVDAGFLVIACGGGGIPVIEKNGASTGIDAVIDKDLASERLATLIGATRLILLTDVDGLYDNYGKSNQQLVSKIRLNEINKRKIADLAEGDMGPKVRASLTFIENGGKEAVIGNLKRLSESLDGTAGTHIVP